jgi:beta-1,4-mannosyl-glycoprotein beta-1,4-N-acetylglucosaminyltransferase
MLKYRLAMLDSAVDYFVIVEANTTFSGLDKELTFKKNKKLFKEYNEKIIHVVVTDLPHKGPDIDFTKSEQWNNEYFQRNCITRGLQQLKLDPQDYIMISDVDEIPDPTTLHNIKEFEIKIEAGRLEQDFYYYNLNTKFVSPWYYAVIMSYEKYLSLELSPQDCRMAPYFSIVKKGGWHLSFFGDANFIIDKINKYSHQEYNVMPFINPIKIAAHINDSSDLFDRTYNYDVERIPVSENVYLPPKYDTLLSKFVKI